MTDPIYGRGQADWALWETFTFSSATAPKTAPRVFGTRIKRLLEIDRKLDLDDVEVKPESDYAFAPPPSEQTGEIAYRTFDVFCLAVALDLLDAGYKQQEVVFLMRYLRSGLEAHFADMLGPPTLLDRRPPKSAELYPQLPYFEHEGRRCVDKRMFIILRKVEMKEIIPEIWRARFTRPVLQDPIFCAGIEAVREALHAIMPSHRRAVTVLELARNAQAVEAFLKAAPAIRRGRPKTRG